MIKTHTLAVRPSAQIRDKLRVKLSATDTAKAALLGFMMLLASASGCYSGALAAAAEPSPATPPVVTFGEGSIIAIGIGLIAFLAKLVKSLGEIKSAGRSFVREEITLAAADKKGGELPQPLVTKKHEENIGRREFERFAETTNEELRELRKSDDEHARRVMAEILKITGLLGEVRAGVESLNRKN